jgi:hypothetical protein
MALRLIKGGKEQDMSQEVNLQFGKLMLHAAYFGKTSEMKEIQDLLVEYDQESKQHLLLLELFKKFDGLLQLGEVPMEFFQKFKAETEMMAEMERKPAKKAKKKKGA